MQFHFLRYPWKGSFTGMLLIAGEKRCVLVDTALPEAIDGYLLPYLKQAGIPLESIELVVNTHNHEDHAGGNARLRELCAAKFAIHRNGAEWLERGGFHPDLLLDDGSLLPVGEIRLGIVHLPGHSPDSIGVLDSASGTMFTGDSLQGRGTEYSGIALYADPESYLQSIDRMETLFGIGRVRRLICGHAFAPYEGTVSEADVTDFLEACRDSVCAYDYAITDYLADHPAATAAELGHVLVERYGITRELLLPGIEANTAAAHLRARR